VVAVELRHEPSGVRAEGTHRSRPSRSASIMRVRWAAVAFLMLGVALASIAIGCLTGTTARLVDALPGDAAVHLAHPARYGFMYTWFAGLSFFAAWFSATQARLPR